MLFIQSSFTCWPFPPLGCNYQCLKACDPIPMSRMKILRSVSTIAWKIIAKKKMLLKMKSQVPISYSNLFLDLILLEINLIYSNISKHFLFQLKLLEKEWDHKCLQRLDRPQMAEDHNKETETDFNFKNIFRVGLKS